MGKKKKNRWHIIAYSLWFCFSTFSFRCVVVVVFFFFWIGFNAVPGLSTLDYITVAVIEKYLDFKVRKTLIMLDTLSYPSKKGKLGDRL